MGIFYSKYQEDENCLQIEDLPDEMIVEIFSYLNKTEKIKISMVNKRWFGIINNEIKTLSIRWPQEKNQEIQNLILRFPRLKNLELATKITNKDLILPLDSFENKFDGTMEFEISSDLIQTKNPKFTFIERIKINPAKEKDFEYKEDQIMNFYIEMIPTGPINQSKIWDSIIEEIRSLDKLSKIEYFEDSQHGNLSLVKLMEAFLSLPYLKEIVVHLMPADNYPLDTEEEYPKNWSVEEITFKTWAPSFKFLNKVLDALPNIKKVEIFNDNDFENLPVFLKNISGLKHLKSLNVAISRRSNDENFDAQLGHVLEIIKK